MAHRNGEIPTSALTPLSVGGHLLSAPAAAFEEWRRQAAAGGRVLTITSTADAYRVLAVQERVFLQRYIPQATGGGIYSDIRWYRGVRYVRRHGAAAAVPGTSNHGRGLAIDVANVGPFGGKFHEWLLKSGPALGWSNTEGRSVGEPWHWVHDGVTLASAGTGTSTGLAPSKPIAIPTITLPEDDMPTAPEIANAVLNTPDPALSGKTVHQVLADLMHVRQDVAAVPNEVLFGNRVGGRNLVDQHLQTRAEIAGLQSALTALAKAQGADPAVITKAVRDGVAAALKGVETTVTLKGA